jgi:hypothetical protein
MGCYDSNSSVTGYRMGYRILFEFVIPDPDRESILLHSSGFPPDRPRE